MKDLAPFLKFEFPQGGVNLKEILMLTEKRFVERALIRTNGNCAAAAKLLGINRTTLVEARRRHHLPLKPPMKWWGKPA